MILDLIACIFIVVLSFILCMNDNNNYKCQLSHIILGLSVIVFYKLAKYFKLNQAVKSLSANTVKENFNDSVTASINDFLSGNSVGNSVLTPNQAQSLSPANLASYNQKLTELINSINDLKNQQNAPPPNVAVSPDTVQKLDLESQQQYQMFQIDYLNKQIQNAKDIINSQTVNNASANYKPIKVYSSCVISNANGTTSVDVPVNSSQTPLAQLQHSTSSAAQNNSATQQMLQTISQGNPQSQGSMQSSFLQQSGNTGSNSLLNLSSSTGLFSNLINGLANGNVNVSI
jgi:hypothetical protein